MPRQKPGKTGAGMNQNLSKTEPGKYWPIHQKQVKKWSKKGGVSVKIRKKLAAVVLRVVEALNMDNLCLVLKYAYSLLDQQERTGH